MLRHRKRKVWRHNMKIKTNRTFWFRAASVLLLIVIAVIMVLIGRKHIIYLDNKALEYDGGKVSALYKVEFVNEDGETKKLYQRERGEIDIMGQTKTIDLLVTEKKGGEEVAHKIKLSIPFKKDAVVVNVPALLAGLDESIWMTDFVSLATASETTEAKETVDLTDDFGIGSDL